MQKRGGGGGQVGGGGGLHVLTGDQGGGVNEEMKLLCK